MPGPASPAKGANADVAPAVDVAYTVVPEERPAGGAAGAVRVAPVVAARGGGWSSGSHTRSRPAGERIGAGVGGGGSAASGCAVAPQPTRSQPKPMHPTGPHARSRVARAGMMGSGSAISFVQVIPPSVDSKPRRDAVQPKAQRPDATGAPASRMYSPTRSSPPAE